MWAACAPHLLTIPHLSDHKGGGPCAPTMGVKEYLSLLSRMLSRMLACRKGPGKQNILVQIQEQEERALINALDRGAGR